MKKLLPAYPHYQNLSLLKALSKKKVLVNI